MARRKKPLERPASPEADLAARVRHLLVLDATSLLARVEKHEDEMVRLFSRLRDRSPLMTATHTAWPTVGFDALASLSPAQQRAATLFYEKVADLRWYLQYTEDMPLQLRQTLELAVKQLGDSHRVLVAALGPLDADGKPVVDAQVAQRAPVKVRDQRR